MNRVIIVLYNVLSTDSNTNRLQPTGSDYFDLVEMIRACAKRKALRARTAEATPRRFASSQPRPNKKPPFWVGTLHGGDDQGLRKAQSSASTNSRGYASPVRVFTTPTKQKNHPFGWFFCLVEMIRFY